MKRVFIWFAGIMVLIALTIPTSCAVMRVDDAGKHKGWFKNRHNPHHPNSNNPGNADEKVKKKPAKKIQPEQLP